MPLSEEFIADARKLLLEESQAFGIAASFARFFCENGANQAWDALNDLVTKDMNSTGIADCLSTIREARRNDIRFGKLLSTHASEIGTYDSVLKSTAARWAR